MSSQLQKGTTFADTGSGATVNAAALNGLADNAVLLPGAVNEQTATTTVVSADNVLLYQNSSGQLRKTAIGVLLTFFQTFASPIVQIFSGTATPASSYQTTHFLWIRLSSSGNFARFLALWDATKSAWRPVRTMPVGSIVQFAGDASTPGANFDSTGLGIVGASTDGWALCNGNHGTVNITSGTFIQFVDLS